MAGIRLPLEEPETTPQQQARATATDSLASDDDQSIAADSWSIKSEYGSNLDDERHADTTEALSSALDPSVWLLAPPVQSRSVHARFVTKRHEVEQKVENGGGQWNTLDSQFAIMKEHRKSNKNNNNGVKVMHVPRLPPWARARRFYLLSKPQSFNARSLPS